MRFYQKAWRIYTEDLTPCRPNIPRHPNEPKHLLLNRRKVRSPKELHLKMSSQKWVKTSQNEANNYWPRRPSIRLLNAHSRPDQNKGPPDCLVACLDTCSLWLALCSDKTLSALWNLPVGVFSLESSNVLHRAGRSGLIQCNALQRVNYRRNGPSCWNFCRLNFQRPESTLLCGGLHIARWLPQFACINSTGLDT